MFLVAVNVYGLTVKTSPLCFPHRKSIHISTQLCQEIVYRCTEVPSGEANIEGDSIFPAVIIHTTEVDLTMCVHCDEWNLRCLLTVLFLSSRYHKN